MQRLPLHALSPQPGWVERDMTELWQQCGSVISKLLAHTGVSGSQIRGLGISAQGKGLFLLDKSDRPLGKAILSSDRRAMEIVQRWQKFTFNRSRPSAGKKKRFRKNSTR
ncbi:Xylulose kinase [Salmonella enterica subsp. enterica serovar Hvittingfoss str. A4-620]|nr:Xylulose kinase [Salmonella enterica subsp. enterica serovar Hvittingfoss str. A4-620]